MLKFDDGASEASFIAGEIARLFRASQGLFDYSDFSVLLRTNSMSRGFEEALSQRGIKYRVVGGLRFFDRADIKNCIAYLRVAANAHDAASCDRVINLPPRGIGDVTLEAMRRAARERGCSLYEVAKMCANGGAAALNIKRAGEVKSFVDTIEMLQRMVAEVRKRKNGLIIKLICGE